MTPTDFLQNFCQGSLQDCIQGVYNLWLAIAVAIAFLYIVIGSLEYMTSAAINKKGAGKKKITGAIIGLVVIFASGSVLYWINPHIFNAELIIFSVTKLEPPKFTESRWQDPGHPVNITSCQKIETDAKNLLIKYPKLLMIEINEGEIDTQDKRARFIGCMARAETSCDPNDVGRQAAGLLSISYNTPAYRSALANRIQQCHNYNIATTIGKNCGPNNTGACLTALKNIELSVCLGLLYSSSYTNPNSRVYFQKMGYTSGSLTNILRIYNAGYYKPDAGLNYAKSITNCINK